MIDTTTIENIWQPKPLKLISIDFDNLVNNNLSIMKDYLQKYTNNQNNNQLSFENYLIGIHETGRVAISPLSFFDGSLLGVCSTLKVARNDLTIHDWAITILTRYCKWLKAQYQAQSNMPPDKICNLLKHKTFYNALFNKTSYGDWILCQIDSLTAKEINFQFLPILNHHFIQKLLIRLQQINVINSSVVSRLLENIITYYDICKENCNYTCIINLLSNLLLQQSNIGIKMHIDQQIDYSLVVTSLYHLQAVNYIAPKQIILPIEGIYHIDMKSILNDNTKYHIPHNKQSQLLQIELAIKHSNSIELLINNLWHYIFYTNENKVIANIKMALKYFKISRIKMKGGKKLVTEILNREVSKQHITKTAKDAIYQILNLLFAE